MISAPEATLPTTVTSPSGKKIVLPDRTIELSVDLPRPDAGQPPQTVRPRGRVDLGTTGRLGVTAWGRR